MEELFLKIEQEKQNRFKKQWSKLDKGSKLDRLLLFVKMKKAELQLSDTNEKQFKGLIIQLHNSNIFNKSSEIDYDIETCEIKEIHNLQFDEDSNKFSFIKPEKKNVKKNSSQNSNIERHFNRSKKSSSKSSKTI